MILYPAMDLMGGRVARLRQGRFDDPIIYAADPAEALAQFAAEGASWAHVVDLDGARAGEPVQHDLVARLAGRAPLQLQVGGGIRTRDQIARLLDAGVARVVVGSLAVQAPDLVRDFLEEFGSERITLSLDVRVVDGIPLVVTSGWTDTSALSLWEVAALHPLARHILLTDVGKDGMMAGPNFALLREATERLPHAAIQASGGVTSLDDLRQLPTAGAILGRAIWEGRITIPEAIRAVG